MSKKIGILGSGAVARALAEGFSKHGYEVTLGTRSPEKLEEWRAGRGAGVIIGSFSDAAAFGQILVLAVKGYGAKGALALAGRDHLQHKTILDATNPIAPEPPVEGVLKYFTTLDRSLMEDLQETYPDAHFVKAFNSVGNAQMVNPAFDTRPSMFICGDDAQAKAEATEILTQFGWETWDMGKAIAARAIEPMAMLWCIPGFLENRWNHAFKILK